MNEKKLQSFRIDPDVHRRLKVFAAKDGLTLGKAIEALLREAEALLQFLESINSLCDDPKDQKDRRWARGLLESSFLNAGIEAFFEGEEGAEEEMRERAAQNRQAWERLKARCRGGKRQIQ